MNPSDWSTRYQDYDRFRNDFHGEIVAESAMACLPTVAAGIGPAPCLRACAGSVTATSVETGPSARTGNHGLLCLYEVFLMLH